MSFGKYLKDVKAQIRETDVESVRKVVEARKGKTGDGNGAGPILIDVREKDEWIEGNIPGARWIPRGFLEQRIEDQVPETSSEIVLYCAGGTRSALAARSLEELGYTNVKSMAGGFTAWKRAGLPFDRPFIMTQEQSLRYARHTMLPEVGEAGQVKLLKSKVLCLGAGGLGSPSGLYLAAAGVGTIGFVDDDVVDASNLQRQILHATDRVGLPKVESARRRDRQAQPRRQGDRPPDAPVVGERDRHHQGLRLDRRRRRQLPDALPAERRGAQAGQAGRPRQHLPLRGPGDVVHPDKGPCYRCLYPSPPPPDMAPSCQEAGVLGVLCGVIGSLQATEAIKILLGIGKPLPAAC